MPRATWTQHNFNGGEWSPLTYGRSDLQKYHNALATCQNYIPTTQGALVRRPGFAYVAMAKNFSSSSAKVRLVPFEFSTAQSYVLEFGNNYTRFYTNDGQLLENPVTILSIVGSTVTTSSAHGYLTGQEVFIGNYSGGWGAGRNYLVTVVSPTVFTVTDLAGVAATPSGNSAGRVYEIYSSYTTADLDALTFTQSADTLYVAHPSYAPTKIQRTGAVSWTSNAITFLDGPYLLLNSTTTTLTASGTTGTVTLTASSTTGINGGAGFSSSDSGRVVRLKVGSTWGWGVITGVVSTTQCNFSISSTLGGTTATTLWRLGVWSIRTGYPAAVGFHQDRLWWAGCPSYPNRIDASNTSDYENMAPSNLDGTVVDSNALSFSLNTNKMNAINWLVSDEWGMLAGTASAEWVIAASTQQNAITPTNVTAKPVTSYGSTAVAPVRAGKSTLFFQRAKRKLREMSYQFTLGTFQSPDISLVSEHLTKSGIRQIAWAQQPIPVVWMARTDGTLVGMTYDKDQDVIAWHQHSVGGYSDAGQTAAPIVESVCSIPSPDTSRDELWISVLRYINGGYSRTIERLTKYWEDGDTLTGAFFVDSGASYSGSPTTTVSGLFWLKGQTVKVLADGSVHPDCVVDNTGAITLQRSASNITVGLGYNSEGKTMRIEAGGADGGAQGKIKRIHRTIFRFFQSLGLNVFSWDLRAMYPQSFRTSADRMDSPPALYDGDKVWTYDGTYDREGQVYWQQSDPLPSNVTQLVVQLETQDGG